MLTVLVSLSRLRRWIPLAALIAFALAATLRWHPDPPVRRAVGIVLATLILWISEIAPLGAVAMGIPVAAVLAGILDWKDAAAAWGDPVVFLFLGAFLLARALEKHGAFEGPFVRRSLQACEGRSPMQPALLVLAFAGLLSTCQNNTAVAALLLPLVVPMARRSQAPAVVLLALSWGATFGGLATPVGTAPNFIGFAAMKRAGAAITFVDWLRVGVPAWLGTTLIGCAVLMAAARRERTRLAHSADSPPTSVDAAAVIFEGSGWTRQSALETATSDSTAPTSLGSHSSATARRWAVAAMTLAALFWLVPGLILGVSGESAPTSVWLRRYLPESLVPIAAAWALFVVRAGPRGAAVLDKRDLLSLDWDTLFLIAGGLCLGVTLERSGAAAALARGVSGASLHPALLTFAVAAATVLLSELTSNTATAALMVPMAGSLAAPMGLPAPSAIWLVSLCASMGFLLPVSTPPNALVYGTRLIPLRVMAATGAVVDILATTWIVLCVRWFA